MIFYSIYELFKSDLWNMSFERDLPPASQSLFFYYYAMNISEVSENRRIGSESPDRN